MCVHQKSLVTKFIKIHTVRAATKLGKASKQRLKACKEGINNAAMAQVDKLGTAIALFENLLA